MKPPTTPTLLFAAMTLACGCAAPDARTGDNDHRFDTVHSSDGYYGVIDSIEPRPAGDTRTPDDAYVIRVRFDDRSYRTVTQASLDGLRIGDNVRIERDRVRRY